MRLLNTIFSERDKFYFVFYFSLAIRKIKKSKILATDFPGIILSLQNLEDLEMENIPEEVTKIKKCFEKKRLEKL
jgi:hypothetical protein